ncbi:MAG: DUF1501 domain-containing protein, partial [Planctomycetales bacterium]
TGELKTSVPGVTFGGTFPQLAQRMNRMAVVRSFSHGVGSHGQAHVHVLTGGTDPKGDGKSGFSMGSLYGRLRGTNHPQSGLPTYSLLTEPEIDGQYSKELGRVRAGSHAGSLGASFAPFEHQTNAAAGKKKSSGKKSGLAADMQLNLADGRFDDRMKLLSQLDQLNRKADSSGMMDGVDRFNSQAVDLLLGGAADAFDFRTENPATLERYDTSKIKIGFKRFRESTLGKQMLVARRLIESGCGFVTVHSAGWDMHADGNNPGMTVGMDMLGRTLDQAVSAFLDDLRERGMSDDVLLVVTGDFGRTPRINKKGGRDHWSRLGTLAFAGGGLRMGQVIGQSARGADVPATEPIGPKHLMGAVMNTLFDPGLLRLETGVPRELSQMIDGAETIPQLFS